MYPGEYSTGRADSVRPRALSRRPLSKMTSAEEKPSPTLRVARARRRRRGMLDRVRWEKRFSHRSPSPSVPSTRVFHRMTPTMSPPRTLGDDARTVPRCASGRAAGEAGRGCPRGDGAAREIELAAARTKKAAAKPRESGEAEPHRRPRPPPDPVGPRRRRTKTRESGPAAGGAEKKVPRGRRRRRSPASRSRPATPPRGPSKTSSNRETSRAAERRGE